VAKAVGAIFMVDMAHYAGLVAAGFYPNPVPHADVVTTTTHKTLRGPRGGLILMRPSTKRRSTRRSSPALQGGPLMHVIAAKAAAFKEAMTQEFKNYQEQVIDNAQVMAKVLKARGLRIVSGRTESHVFLVDLRAKNLTGKEAEAALGRAHMTVNKNTIPNDPQKPFVTRHPHRHAGHDDARLHRDRGRAGRQPDRRRARRTADEAVLARVRGEVSALCKKFPVYGYRHR
jgi:glycine hydroxymethyltransferase